MDTGSDTGTAIWVMSGQITRATCICDFAMQNRWTPKVRKAAAAHAEESGHPVTITIEKYETLRPYIPEADAFL